MRFQKRIIVKKEGEISKKTNAEKREKSGKRSTTKNENDLNKIY